MYKLYQLVFKVSWTVLVSNLTSLFTIFSSWPQTPNLKERGVTAYYNLNISKHYTLYSMRIHVFFKITLRSYKYDLEQKKS